MNQNFYRVGIGAACETLQITHYREEGIPGPDAFATLAWLPEKGFELTMWCFEEDPLAVYRNPNEPVHTDSCMECFLNVFPELEDKGYISVESNANGASHSSFGTDRHNRDYILNLGQPHPEVEVTYHIRDGRKCWQTRTIIRRDVLESLYGRPCNFGPGHKMRANFYKCAEAVAQPHWGAWSAVSRLDFHMPEHFGFLEIV